jgi:Protein of unknown function (DUF2384)
MGFSEIYDRISNDSNLFSRTLTPRARVEVFASYGNCCSHGVVNPMSFSEHSDNPRVREILDRALYLFAGNEKALQEWLHRPDPQLSDMTPQEVLDAGQHEAVAFIIEAALEGDPD